MEMKCCPLYSGSSGNCFYVEYGDSRVLVDVGRSGKMTCDCLTYSGVDPSKLTAILVTHEHSDHTLGVGILSRKYKLPIYATEGTWQGMERALGKLPEGAKHVIANDEDFYIGQLGVAPFPISHDAADPVGYRFWGSNMSVATCTDLGYFNQRLLDTLSGTNLVLLESNHDPDLLMANEHYSMALKRRILSRKGHLSNADCAEAIVQLVKTGVNNVILGHLSGENNRPQLALRTSENLAQLEGIVLGDDLHIDLAWRDRVGGMYTLQED